MRSFSMLSLLAALLLAALPLASAACPDGHFCVSDSIRPNASVACVPSYYCPGNVSATLCEKGFYCPTPASRVPCPAGSYCPPASVQPRECSPLAFCPAGSWRYFNWGCLLLLLILLPLIAAAGPVAAFFSRRGRSASYVAEGGSKSPQSPVSPATTLSLLHAVPRMDVVFSSLCASVASGGGDKVILADVSGHFRPGRLVAVMGPSGAGKSSLIGALTGTLKVSGGSVEVRIEGALESDLRRARARGMIGVVPQSDIMIPQLTPRDILTHSAFARLPANWTAQAKRERVDETLAVLGLSKVQHTPVGDEDVRGVSGGEKKRTSIGIELVNCPSLLVLDEPTTGLDATSSQSLVGTLKAITALQTTVVAVLHQPRNEIFRAMDDLLLLAPGGRTVYFGPAALTQAYFASVGWVCDPNTNPSDFFIDVIAGKAGGPMLASGQSALVVDNTARTTAAVQAYLVEQWKGSAGKKFADENGLNSPAPDVGAAAPAAQKFKSAVVLPSRWALLYLFAYRGVLQLVRNLTTVRLELLMHVVAGSVIGMAFVDDNWFLPPLHPAYVRYCPPPMQRSCAQDAIKDNIDMQLTYTCMALGLVAAIIGNRNYGQELVNMARESSAGLSPTAYFWGKAVAELPLIVVYSFLYCVSYYLVCSPAAPFGQLYSAVLFFEFVLFGIGYVCSLLLNGENALLLSAICSLIAGLGTDATLIKSLCWARWFGEAMYLSETRTDLLVAPSDSIVQGYMDGRSQYKLGNFNTDILALFIMGCVLRLLAWALVWRKFSKTK